MLLAGAPARHAHERLVRLQRFDRHEPRHPFPPLQGREWFECKQHLRELETKIRPLQVSPFLFWFLLWTRIEDDIHQRRKISGSLPTKGNAVSGLQPASTLDDSRGELEDFMI